MINICVFCNPNYKKNERSQTIVKEIDLVSQFIILYKSIKANWKKLDYDITLFYNKNIEWSTEDKERINKLKDLNLIGVDEGDHPNYPWMTKIPCFNHKLKKIGTHRLILDCDMIALNEPNFDLSCDWQAMFAGSVNKEVLKFLENSDYINLKQLNLQNKICDNLFERYMLNITNYKDLFPHFNGGAFLIKENLANKLSIKYKKCYEYTEKTNNNNIKHIGIQYLISLYLYEMSSNWKPFEQGFNYLIKVYDVNKFGKNNIKLIHYCGINATDICFKEFPEYFKNL